MNTSLETICEQTAQAESPTSPRRRILVVEDDRVLRQVIAMVLVRSGYEVDMAEDGAAAWETLQANSYDLLVTDNNMPKLTGIELLKKVRSAHMGMPAVIVSGTLPKQELAQNPGLEPVAPLAKPYAPEQLLDTVKGVLHVAVSKRNPGMAVLFILLVLVFSAVPVPAMDRFDALSQIESHDNDRAVGPQCEVSRYQILPEFWEQTGARNKRTNVTLRATDPGAAKNVAYGIMKARCSAFETRYHRAPDDFEFYILWHRPACFIGRAVPRPITAIEADRGHRFASLCQQ